MRNEKRRAEPSVGMREQKKHRYVCVACALRAPDPGRFSALGTQYDIDGFVTGGGGDSLQRQTTYLTSAPPFKKKNPQRLSFIWLMFLLALLATPRGLEPRARPTTTSSDPITPEKGGGGGVVGGGSFFL
ncbi:hypothetical protein L249_6101 [Ophiocordyceps polyrhachis-furcata BCC 54312]|uniref:Uncharacterized protein n=1 Tax=Ophiocordyceps polyrhachis-furcata BCC 54312 TaxID=1330021 RepID=A0A367LJB5_9HYPO|nr:hypothetical protein L249_6101 [Ophiocordyceps polyrhachis-furcata BCC 54312]